MYNTNTLSISNKMPVIRRRLMRTVYFKVVNTENRREYHVDPSWRIDDFINIMKSHIIRDFNMEQFELVEAGQNTVSGRSEDGVALNRYEQISLREKYGDNLNVSFYIRPINYRIEHENENENENVVTNMTRIISECVVCFEDLPSIRRYMCRHSMCTLCLNSCMQNNIHSCPMCRCQILLL